MLMTTDDDDEADDAMMIMIDLIFKRPGATNDAMGRHQRGFSKV